MIRVMFVQGAPECSVNFTAHNPHPESHPASYQFHASGSLSPIQCIASIAGSRVHKDINRQCGKLLPVTLITMETESTPKNTNRQWKPFIQDLYR